MDLKYTKLYWEKLAAKKRLAENNEILGYVLISIGFMLFWALIFFNK